jgi:hypothetical protein
MVMYFSLIQSILSWSWPSLCFHHPCVHLHFTFQSSIIKKIKKKNPGQLWSWSYCSWISNYLCNQCLSPLKVVSSNPVQAMCTRYSIMWYSLSVACGRSVVFIGYSGFLHCNIVESGIKHHKPTNQRADGKCNFRMVTHFKLIPSIFNSPVDPGHHVASIIHVILIIRNPNPRWPSSQEIV